MSNVPRFSAKAAPVTKPLPLWILYPLFFVVVYTSHWPLMRLPYFWDEAGYYIPAALDFFHTGSLIPQTTLTNAHPPLPSILLTGWWHISGFVPIATRTFVCMISAAALLAVFRLARTLAGSLVASVVALLTALYPVWFAQSSLAHADIFAALFTLWALSFYVEQFNAEGVRRNRFVSAAVLFALAALSKETAIVTPVALAAWELAVWTTERKQESRRASLAWAVALAAPIVPLAGWYLYHRSQTGYLFGNPEFLRYNATANLGPARVLLSFWHRLAHLTYHMSLYVPIVCALALLWGRRGDRTSADGPIGEKLRTPALRQPVLLTLVVIVLGNALAFSVLGGALLTRYLLPLYPLILLVCVAVWRERTRPTVFWMISGLSAIAFTVALFVNPPYSIAPEDNLTYRDFVQLHQGAIRFLGAHYPAATVLTAWPASTELEHPYLGYTPRPFKTVAVDNFSPAEMAKAAADPGAFDTALVFSTKWVPPPGRLNLGARSESVDSRFYDFHHDLSPAQAALVLHGDVVWQQYRNGEWAAILRFPRVVEARNRQ